jgi:cytochrome c oxidase subunit 1
MFGGTITAFLAGLHYWWPKMTGKMYSERMGRIAWAFIFVGFQITFFTQFIMGAKGMPRRYWSYLPEFQPYHVISTLGSYIMGTGFFLVAGLLLHSLYRGRRAGPNPWGAATLEWETNSRPPWDNFAETPAVGDPYDLEAFQPEPEKATWVRTLPKERLAAPHG